MQLFEIQGFVCQIKERHMSDLFANFRATINVQEERRIGREVRVRRLNSSSWFAGNLVEDSLLNRLLMI